MWNFFSRKAETIQKFLLVKIRQFCTVSSPSQNIVVPWQPTNILWVILQCLQIKHSFPFEKLFLARVLPQQLNTETNLEKNFFVEILDL
jgi:hypothetical protein